MLTNSSAILTHPFCTPHRRIKTSVTTLPSSTFLYRTEEDSRKDPFMQTALRKNSLAASGILVDASRFTALVKTPRYKGEAPAKALLPQAVPRNSFVIAGTETPRKGAASVERGPREW